MDLENAIKYGKRINTIQDKFIDVRLLPYYFVKWGFLELANEDYLKATKKALEYLKLEYNTLDSRVLNSIFLYIYDQLLTENGIIYQLENEHLSSNHDPLMIVAGVNKLAPYNNLMTLYYLANEDVTKMEEVSKQPYHLLLDIQAFKNIQDKVNKVYQDLISKKK